MEPINFKFRFIDANGRETGFFASSGELTQDALTLDNTVLPLGCIYQVVHRYNRLAIVYHSDNGPVTLTIAPRGGLERKLKETIDRLCSYRWVENRREQLVQEGKAAAFRTAKCRLCTAMVDLTGFRETPQFYCPYCQNILQSDYRIDEEMNRYRLCDRCQFYSLPIRFTAAYVILNFVSWREHHSCHVCMRRECWKMLLGNVLPPFIGIIFAIGHTIRAYAAGSLDSRLPELVSANAYAHRGRIEQAETLYQTMLERLPVQAGLRYNLALAHARAKEWDRSLAAALEALDDCSNYSPAATLVCQALNNSNRPAEAEQFLKSWGIPGSEVIGSTPLVSEQIQRGRPASGGEGIREA
jgi:hypothetical protein